MKRMVAAMAVAWLAIGPAACGDSRGADTAADDLPLAFPDSSADDAAVPGDPGRDEDATGPDAPGDPDADGTDPGAPPDDPGPADDAGPDDSGAGDPGTDDPGPPACRLSEEQCFGPPIANGTTAGTPFSVSRQLLYLNGQMWNPDNQDAGNDDDLPSSYCRDAGPDQFFRVYLMAGETLNIQMVNPPELDMNIKIYRGIAGDDEAALQGCEDKDTRAYWKDGYYDIETYPFQVPADDWYTVVADGATADDLAQYLLQMNLLNCTDPDCCCP